MESMNLLGKDTERIKAVLDQIVYKVLLLVRESLQCFLTFGSLDIISNIIKFMGSFLYTNNLLFQYILIHAIERMWILIIISTLIALIALIVWCKVKSLIFHEITSELMCILALILKILTYNRI